MIVIHYNSNTFYVHRFLQRLQNEIKNKSVGQNKLTIILYAYNENVHTRNGRYLGKVKTENSESSSTSPCQKKTSQEKFSSHSAVVRLTETLSSSCFGNGPKLEVNNMNCYLCGKSASSIECHTCHQAWFCSHEHLEELHRPPLCFPIKVATSEVVGRYLVASRDLAPLDLILSDTATPSGK